MPNTIPLADRILVEPTPMNDVTESGLFIPHKFREKSQRGVIVSVGPGRISDDGKTHPMVVKPGMEILYGKYSGHEIELDGKQYMIMRESDIYTIVGKFLTPLYDWVILKPIPEADYFESSVIQLVRPDTSKKRPTRGVVMARGLGRVNQQDGQYIDMPFNVGDTVVHGKYSGTEIKYNGEEYLMIKEIEIMMKEE